MGAPAATNRLFLLPGGRVGTDRLSSYPRTAWRTGRLIGTATLPLRRALRSNDRPGRHRALRDLAARALRSLDATLEVVGVDRIEPHRAYVVAPLHESLLDPAAVLQLPLAMVFAMRSELYDWRIVGPLLQRTGQITIDPEHGRAGYRRLLRQAPGHLASGTSVTVFPQGSVLGIEAAFSPAAFRLAQRCSVPILPVIITGSHRVWEYPYSPRIRYGQRIRMEVMAPIAADVALADLRMLERAMKAGALAATPQPRRYVPERDGWWDGYRFAVDPDYPELAAAVAAHRSAHAGPGPNSR